MATLPSKEKRPVGITILGILSAMVLGIGVWIWISLSSFAIPFIQGLGLAGDLLVVIFVIPLIIQAVICVSFFIGKSWARLLVLIFAIIGLVVDLLSLNLIGFIINAIIIWYLQKPNVKRYFGV